MSQVSTRCSIGALCQAPRYDREETGYIGFDAFEEIMIQRYAAQDPMDEIRKAFEARRELFWEGLSLGGKTNGGLPTQNLEVNTRTVYIYHNQSFSVINYMLLLLLI